MFYAEMSKGEQQWSVKSCVSINQTNDNIIVIIDIVYKNTRLELLDLLNIMFSMCAPDRSEPGGS